MSGRRLIFFGDSICVGQGVSIHMGWVTRIAIRLAEIAGENLVVVNASANGSTTRQALERMPYEVQSHGVDILIIQFGLNDCNYWESDHGVPRVSKKAFEANLEEIISRGKGFGANSIILNTNHPTARNMDILPNTNITFEDSNRQYNMIIRQVAKKLGDSVVLNDVETEFHELSKNGVADLHDLLLSDGLHLSARGHEVYYDLITPLVESRVKDLLKDPQ